jgi:putative aminopeptidase FrvX
MELPRRPLRPLLTALALAAAVLLAAESPAALPGASAPDRADELLAFLRIPAVTGHEGEAARFVRSRLAGLPPASIASDALGGVVVTLGSGSPRRLVACPLDEPGFVISHIQEDGYLRLAPSGNAPVGALWEQAHQGQPLFVGGKRGLVPGAVALPSVHLIQGRPLPEAPFRIADAFVDVGAQNAAEVAALGIRLLDPATLVRRPLRLADGLVAGTGARSKGAALALAEAARRFAAAGTGGSGTVVFAWTTQGLFDEAGLKYLSRQRGPFDEVILLSPRFGWETKDGRPVPGPLPPPGADLPAAGKLPDGLPGVKPAPHLDLEPYVDDKLDWGAARVGELGLPALYPGTPVEAVAPADVLRLAGTLLTALGRKDASAGAALPPLPAPPALPPVPTAPRHARAAEILGALIARAGVSGAEGPVREEVLQRLPAWAKPTVDAQGDVTVSFGPASGTAPKAERVLFVAHLDEVGFRVAEMLPDGRLRLAPRGSLARPVWEAQAAVVHGDRGPVPAVFEPRVDWATTEKRLLPGDLTVALGVSSAAAAEALGIHVGTTVTLPKEMLRLGPHRVLGRACDDRVGSTALLLALGKIDPAKLKHLRQLRRQVTFAWSVREEVGLEGAGFLARTLPPFDRVFAVDTFVTADSPLESPYLGYAKLGQGPVLRARDNAFVASPELVHRTLALAHRQGIPLQLGMTGGTTDGGQFTPTGAQVLPFGWPGRYSHSPIEVADLRDVEALARLIVALAAEP